MARYVPKTYNNRRLRRLIIGAVITIALSVVILFLILFFIFSQYAVEGRLEIPWLIDESETPAPPAATSDSRADEDADLLPEGGSDLLPEGGADLLPDGDADADMDDW